MNVLGRAVTSIGLRWLAGARCPSGRLVEPRRFGIEVEEPACRQRIQGVLGAFFSGLECGLHGPERVAGAAPALPAIFRPFFHEGAAMGFLPNGYLRLTPARQSIRLFEESLDQTADPFLFLRFVGLGFWLGFRHPRRPDRVEDAASSLKTLRLRPLVLDGYGFKIGFFDVASLHPGRVAAHPAIRRLRRCAGFNRVSAFNGFGRSLWFFAMDRPEAGFAAARSLEVEGEGAGADSSASLAAFSGLGLAAVFTFVDDLSRAYQVADKLAGAERRHFSKGMRLALYVRAAGDLAFLRQSIGSLEGGLRVRAERDLGHALAVGEATARRDDFIEAFHAGCLAES